MSTTRNIMSSALFALPFLNYQPVNVSNNEPALQAANLTKQTMLGPPFKWSWNRGQFSAELDETQSSWDQDLSVNVPDYGYMEKIWLTAPDGRVTEITNIVSSLADESAIKRPSSAAVNFEDTTGELTIRMNTIPDVAYAIAGFYQRGPILMTSLANSWAPIPDRLSYIYDWGFMAYVAMLTKDARTAMFMGKFASHLLGAQDGISATQRNIFLGNFLPLVTEQSREMMSTQQGTQARGNT
jgi:hypothetical protein